LVLHKPSLIVEGITPMSSVPIPQPPEIDHAAELAERRHAARCASIRPQHLRQDLATAFSDAISPHALGPLSDLLTMLIDAPIRDDDDLARFVKSQGAMDGPALAKALLELAGKISLQHYHQEVDDAAF
jgi:hypothetical protein